MRGLVPIDHIVSGNLTQDHWAAVAQATKDLATTVLRIHRTETETAGLIDLIAADSAENPTTLVVLDGLHGQDAEPLHDFARHHDLAMLIVSSDPSLRSPAFTHLADSVTVVQPHTQPATTTKLATVAVGHNRYGPTGDFRVAFLEECLAWVDVCDTDTPLFGARP